jgi:hypothetical protein
MQLSGVGRALAVVALAVPLPLAGCGALGLGSPAPGVTSAPAAGMPGGSWIVVQTGSPTPSPTPSLGTPSPSPSASSSMGPGGAGCPADWAGATVLIPLTVTVGRGSLTASWPRQGASGYRVSAVPQDLVTGFQPPIVWRPVAPQSGCIITTRITGLTAGKPYIVWLDAPDAGYQLDGTPNKRSGQSAVVYPS